MPISLNTSLCPQNHNCPMIKICPVGAIAQQGFKAPTIDQQQCIQCGKCVKGCPTKAFVQQ